MSNSKGKWLLAGVALCCLAPAAFAKPAANPDTTCPTTVSCLKTPEGGSTAIYLLGAGLTCLGAMFLRSMSRKATQS